MVTLNLDAAVFDGAAGSQCMLQFAQQIFKSVGRQGQAGDDRNRLASAPLLFPADAHALSLRRRGGYGSAAWLGLDSSLFGGINQSGFFHESPVFPDPASAIASEFRRAWRSCQGTGFRDQGSEVRRRMTEDRSQMAKGCCHCEAAKPPWQSKPIEIASSGFCPPRNDGKRAALAMTGGGHCERADASAAISEIAAGCSLAMASRSVIASRKRGNLGLAPSSQGPD